MELVPREDLQGRDETIQLGCESDEDGDVIPFDSKITYLDQSSFQSAFSVSYDEMLNCMESIWKKAKEEGSHQQWLTIGKLHKLIPDQRSQLKWQLLSIHPQQPLKLPKIKKLFKKYYKDTEKIINDIGINKESKERYRRERLAEINHLKERLSHYYYPNDLGNVSNGRVLIAVTGFSTLLSPISLFEALYSGPLMPLYAAHGIGLIGVAVCGSWTIFQRNKPSTQYAYDQYCKVVEYVDKTGKKIEAIAFCQEV